MFLNSFLKSSLLTTQWLKGPILQALNSNGTHRLYCGGSFCQKQT